MKTIVLSLCAILLFEYNFKGQDLIVTTDGDSINCKISELNANYIYFSFKYENKKVNEKLPINHIADYKTGYFSNTISKAKDNNINKNFKPIRISIYGGFSYHLAQVLFNTPSEYSDYAEKLKYGYNYGGEIDYYFTEFLGIGFKYCFYKTTNLKNNISIVDNNGNKKYGQLIDHLNISFIGPFIATKLIGKKKNSYIMNLGFGYFGYKNDKTIVDSYRIIGGTVGYTIDLGYDWEISERIAIGFQVSLLSGVLREYEIYDKYKNKFADIDKDVHEDLTRIDLSIGIRFIK